MTNFREFPESVMLAIYSPMVFSLNELTELKI